MDVHRIFNSPTLMTLFSLSSKSMSFIIITPFLLSNFNAEEIALWYLLGIFINMQALADFGFCNTFIRVIALSLSGGCSNLRDLQHIENKNRIVGKPNIELTGRIIGTMKRVYRTLSIILLFFLISLSPLLIKNISTIGRPNEGWIAWGIVILFSVINFWGRPYSNFLLAQNKVAVVRRWEGIFNLIALFANILVVLFVDSILFLVFSNQIWVFVNVLRNIYLAHHVKQGYRYDEFHSFSYDKEIMTDVWPLAWRSGLSSLTTQGIVSASGLIYAQIGSATSIGSYLFAEKLYTAIRSFAQAPFYSKIPYLVSLRGKNKIREWEKCAQRGMFLASLIMVIGIIGFDLLGKQFFLLIKSNIEYPNHMLWISLGWAYLLHRYGAMHTQLYSTINKVNSHISDLISGIIMLIVWILFVKDIGVYVFPLGMLCGYILFYIWFAGYYSYKIIDSKWYAFELKANLIPFLILFLYTVISIMRFVFT